MMAPTIARKQSVKPKDIVNRIITYAAMSRRQARPKVRIVLMVYGRETIVGAET